MKAIGSQRWNNRIQDGLDDLISGVTGIRRSRIGALKTASSAFRDRAAAHPEGFFARKALGEQEASEIPLRHSTIQFPATVVNTDGNHTEFPNYIHFRSLARRAKQDGDEEHDIFLYVPDTLNDNLSVTYTEAKLGVIDSLISNFVKTDQVQEGYGVDRQEFATMAASMAGPSKVLMSALGRGVNPLKYQLFEGVAFRTFSYTFTLRPKSVDDSQAINRILYIFKREALPGTAGANSRIYTFPTEWSIQFVGPIKKWVDFPLVSVISGVNVDYAGGQPLALMHDGAPSIITLTINFTETTQMSRQKYDDYGASFKYLDRDLGSQEKGTNINASQTVQGLRAQVEKKIEEVVSTDTLEKKRPTQKDLDSDIHPTIMRSPMR